MLPGSLGRTWSRRCSRPIRRSSGSTISRRATVAISMRFWQRTPQKFDRHFQFVEGDIRDRSDLLCGSEQHRRSASPGRPRLGSEVDRGPAHDTRGQCDGVSQHVGGSTLRGGRALHICRLKLDLRRRAQPAKARRSYRQSPVALCSHETRQRDLRCCLCSHLRFRATGLRYFNVFGPRQDPERSLCRGDPEMDRRDARGRPVRINGDGETSRDFCFVANAVQANILAALAPNEVQGRSSTSQSANALRSTSCSS